MPKRAYPRKPPEKLRIPVSFSLSGDRLEAFRARYGRDLTPQEVRAKASELALAAIDASLQSPPS